MGIGAYSRLRPARESLVIEPVETDELKPVRMMRSAVSLQGNGEIGQIANLQAGLNHSGLLEDDCLFVVSDVVDAVNYKDGDVSPVLEGLLDRYCRAVIGGEVLADSAAVRRVLPVVERHWREKYAADYPDDRIRLESVEWIEAARESLAASVRRAAESLWRREMFANGPVSGLLADLPAEAYEAMLAFNERHSSAWRDLLREEESARRGLPEGNEPAMRAFEAVWGERKASLARALQEEFVKLVADPEGEVTGEELIAAWQQVEALRSVRVAGMRPLNLRLLVWDEGDLGPEVGMEVLKRASRSRELWAADGYARESLLLPLTDRQAEGLAVLEGEVLSFDGRSLVSRDREFSLAVLDKGAAELLRWRRSEGEYCWQCQGRVGGDGGCLVLLPLSN